MAVQVFKHVLGETSFPDYPGPFSLGGCHRLFDDVPHEFRRGIHPAGDPVEMRLIDGFKTLFPTEIERKAVVLDVVNCRYQIVCRR